VSTLDPFAPPATATDGGAPADAPVDGRLARRDRNRAAVLDAIIDLFTEGDLDPSPELVARRAGISPRSVYRYFDDREALLREAIAHHLARVLPLAQIHDIGEGPLDRRVPAFVSHRLRLYETVAATARATRRRAATDEIVREQLEWTRRGLREQIERQFAPELDAMPTRSRRARVAALDAICELETLDHYRVHRGFSTSETETLLVEAIHALLET
jgi:TetR/AcrR family transcriptional regulator, regulator of autoinduction and epiphytic fitness